MDATLAQLLDERQTLRTQLSMALDEIERLGKRLETLTLQDRSEEEGESSGR